MATKENQEQKQPMEECENCGESVLEPYVENGRCPECRDE